MTQVMLADWITRVYSCSSYPNQVGDSAFRLKRHMSVVFERVRQRGHVTVDRLVPERLLGTLSTERQHPVDIDDAW